MIKETNKIRVTKRSLHSNWVPDSDQRYAAIDIGSNGIRLLLSRVMTTGEYCVFAKESLVRMPIRLGSDVFTENVISGEKEDQLVSTMIAFSHLLQAYKPVDYRACATSAMREAINGAGITQRIQEESGLNLEIITGGKEAEIIYASHIAETLNPEQAYLYIDVGGGSTELTIFSKNQFLAARSFPIGTVRMLKGQVKKRYWKQMKHWICSQKPENLTLDAIGSGGNMNKIFRLAEKSVGQPVKFKKLVRIDDTLNSYSVEERIRILQLRPDRADVIIHASNIFRTIMEWGEISKIYVPQFGLVDGLVHVMHEEYLKNQSK